MGGSSGVDPVRSDRDAPAWKAFGSGLVVALGIAFILPKITYTIDEAIRDASMSVLWRGSFLARHEWADWARISLAPASILVRLWLLLAPAVGMFVTARIAGRHDRGTVIAFGVAYAVAALAVSLTDGLSGFFGLSSLAGLLAVALLMSGAGAWLAARTRAA